jgi:hypothetical protein
MGKYECILNVLASAVVCFAGFGVATYRVSAQTMATWNDATGNWTTTSDWNCPSLGVHCIPNNGSGASYNVLINTAYSIVTLDKSSSLTGITINALTVGTAGYPVPISLGIEDGESLNVIGDATGTTVDDRLSVDDIGPGGSSLHVGGNLTNAYGGELFPSEMQVGNPNMTSESTVTVAGEFTGGVEIFGGRAPGSRALLNIGAAVPRQTLYISKETQAVQQWNIAAVGLCRLEAEAPRAGLCSLGRRPTLN